MIGFPSSFLWRRLFGPVALAVLGLSVLAAPVRAQDPADPVTVFAAASLRGALDMAARNYSGAATLSYGGSGAMARQVAQGAPADAVILASGDWMDWLEGQVPLRPASRRNLLGGTLVLVAPAGSAPLHAVDTQALLDILGDGRLAMGQRDAVPAGSYARDWMTSIDAWDALQHRLAETDNVRAALALVSLGEAPLGVVYASDALADPTVSVVWRIPPEQHDPIVYPAAALTPAGAAFLHALSAPQAQAIFAKAGFNPVKSTE